MRRCDWMGKSVRHGRLELKQVPAARTVTLVIPGVRRLLTVYNGQIARQASIGVRRHAIASSETDCSHEGGIHVEGCEKTSRMNMK